MNIGYLFNKITSFIAKYCWIITILIFLILVSYLHYGWLVIPLFLVLLIVFAASFPYPKNKNRSLSITCPQCKIYAAKKSGSSENHPEYICPQCKQIIPAP